MNRRYLRATIAATTLFGALFGAAAWFAPQPRLIWNASASAPIGLYRIDVGRRPQVREIALVEPPAAVGAFLARRGYLPAGTPLLKQVAALPGARICRSGALVTIDGRPAARARMRDRLRRPLPRWSGCRTLRGGEIFVLNPAPDSLDSRYFGPLPAAGVIGRARPVLTRDRPGAPLRWRLGQLPLASLTAEKEFIPC